MSTTAALAAPLRFANGDLLVKLSADGRYDILVHRNAILQHCPALAPVLRAPDDPAYIAAFDNNSTALTLPGHPRPIKLYSIAMSLADGTLLLEGTEYNGMDETASATCVSFDHSQLATEGWPDCDHGSQRDCYRGPEDAARQYNVLFQVLQGFKVDPTQLYTNNGKFTHDSLCFISELCARAEYLGCLPQISKVLLDAILPFKGLWKHVCQEPRPYLLLAVKLRSKHLYLDALRHLLGDPQKTHLSFLSGHLNMDPGNLENWIDDNITEQFRIMHSLKEDLRLLRLETWHKSDRRGRNWHTHTEHRSKVPWYGLNPTDDQQHDLAAHSVVQDYWLSFLGSQDSAQQSMYASSSVPLSPIAGPLKDTIKNIGIYANTDRPADLFGPGVAETLIREAETPTSIEHVTHHLNKCVQSAYTILSNTLRTRTHTQKGDNLVYRQSRCIGDDRHWTYMAVESEVPWERDDEWDEVEVPGSAGLDFTPASRQLLAAVGII
ncbi:hypothetical protein PRZ48_009010 [Zasmidium cellare]|uniref:Uncharacterized protein n=1 Tax=Zasmidium cellare TaxID=395010 RepID=A0ABR0EI59_ZASCE|nr:hypothetical protein PRZ48_009010 [Zasmidium cellare]